MKVFKSVNPGLLTLTIGGLVIGMTEFMMMGVLPDVASSLKISIPTTGHLISVYALGVVIGAPLITAWTAKFNPKKVLMWLMLAFAVFNALFAMSPGIELLLITRLLAGLPHGAFFGMGAVVASRLAKPGKQARAVSLMFAGLTIANIFGVPLGTYIGHTFSWRWSFVLISAVALIAAGSISKWMPELPAGEKFKFSESVQVFKKPEPWIILSVSAIGTGGLFAWISYIAPLMTEVSGFSASLITAIMVIAGLGMAAGNFIGGRLADKFSPLKTTASLMIAMMLSLIILSFVAQFQVAAIAMTFITGAIGFAVISPMQMLMIQATKGSEMLTSSAIQASSNIANALGAFLGGLPIIAGFGYTSPEIVGAGLALSGAGFCAWLMQRRKTMEAAKNEELIFGGKVKLLRRRKEIAGN
jgi:DHA1 family arabinose polymer transporter-like MFS transporter